MDVLTWSEVRDLFDLGRSESVSELIARLEEYRERVGEQWSDDPERLRIRGAGDA